MRRSHAGELKNLFVGQAAQVGDELMSMLGDGAVLAIGTDDILAVPPQRLDRIQFGASFGEPQQLNIQPLCQGQRTLGGVAGIFVEQECHRPATIVPLKMLQKGLEVHRSLALAQQK